MSFYVTCTNNNSEISAYVENLFNPKSKYEVAVVEIAYRVTWPRDFGIFNIYLKNELLQASRIVLYDHSPIENFIHHTMSLFRGLKQTLKTPSIFYSLNKRLLTFHCREDDMKFETNVFGELELASDMNIFNQPNKMVKANFIVVKSDIVKEQIYGNSKQHVLLRHKVEGYAYDWVHKYFTSPQYLDVDRTGLSHINLFVEDERNEKIEFQNEVLIKLHFRTKK